MANLESISQVFNAVSDRKFIGCRFINVASMCCEIQIYDYKQYLKIRNGHSKLISHTNDTDHTRDFIRVEMFHYLRKELHAFT